MLTKRQQRPSYSRSQLRPNPSPGTKALTDELGKFQEIIKARQTLEDLLGGEYTELRCQRTQAIRIGNVVLQHSIVNRMAGLVAKRLAGLKTEENKLHDLRQRILRSGDKSLGIKAVRLVQENMRQASWLNPEKLGIERILADLKPRVELELHRES